MGETNGSIDARFRFLEPGEGRLLIDAIRVAYGETYDVRWVYDSAEVDRRIADETYVSCIAEGEEDGLLCHIGMSLAASGDAVGHAGQAVTLPQARGQHLFTRTKRFLMDWAREQGLAGMFSEATAAHPYSQKAILDLGGHETGFLLGWIPATVTNDAATGEQKQRRQSAALFYTKLNDGHERPVYAPERHHDIIRQTLEFCELRGELAPPPAECDLSPRSELHIEIHEDHDRPLIPVHAPGADLETALASERHHLFHAKNLDALYIDLPLETPATALVSDHLERLGVSYAGVFPNRKINGDVLRMQSLHRTRITTGDVIVSSDHGQELLDYVINDISSTAG